MEASRRRFRPILMTSFAFILGVLPLAIASGAGAASRQALGTAVIGGMLASTLIAILFVPVYYVLMVRLSRWIGGGRKRARPRGAEHKTRRAETVGPFARATVCPGHPARGNGTRGSVGRDARHRSSRLESRSHKKPECRPRETTPHSLPGREKARPGGATAQRAVSQGAPAGRGFSVEPVSKIADHGRRQGARFTRPLDPSTP